MKTTTFFSRITLAAALLVLASNETSARTPFVRINDVSLNASISGNAFGMFYTPSLGLRFGKRFIAYGGPQFNHAWKSAGYQIGTRYMLMRENESYNGKFRLSAFANVARYEKQALGARAVQVEKTAALNMRNDENADFAGMRYDGWEYSAGITFGLRLDCGLLLRMSSALAYYDTKKTTSCGINSFREDKGASLRLGAGIGWAFAK